MKVILNEDIKSLGEEGDICVVKNGYGRNYLIPKGLVLPCTRGNLRILEQRKDAIEKRKAEKREAAKSLKEKIQSTTITINLAAGDSGKLFGSVSNATLTDALAKEGIQVERKKIEVVGTHVKMVGNYTAKVRLYGEEVAELKFIVEGEKTTSEPEKKVASKAKKATELEVAQETVEKKIEEPVAEVAETQEAQESTDEAEKSTL